MAMPACTPDGLAPLIACLKCISKDKLLGIETLLLAQLTGNSTDAATLRRQFACFTCYSDDDLMRMETAIFCAMAQTAGLRSSCTTQSLMDDSKCLQCLPPHDLNAIRLALICQLSSLF